MRENLPCSVVRDLLPAYVEHLTDAETDSLVKTHLQTCRDCAALWRGMAGPEPVRIENEAEVDYLKKVRRSRVRLGLAAACLALLLAGAGLFLLLRKPRAAVTPAASWTYDETTRTVIVYGTGDYDQLELPEEVNKAVNLDAQDDSFHLSIYLPVLRTGDEALQSYIPGFLERTDRSLTFLRTYLQETAGSAYPAENGQKFVELTIRRKGVYEYANDADRILLEVGDFYWHRDSLYLMALLDLQNVEWAQLGYVFYLGMCVNPYAEQNTAGIDVQALPYAEAFLALGGQSDGTPEDMQRMTHAAAWYGLDKGLGRWGSAYESRPVTEFAWYNGPKKAIAGNDMSPAQATSLIAWLAEQYGFEAVSRFCTGSCSFDAAFGTDFPSARAGWEAWLCAAVESGS